jgi:diamine N-acetyltransferase
MMTMLEIKRVVFEDLQSLQEIGRSTFYETYADKNTAENMTKYLAEDFAIEKLKTELDDKNTEFYFAILEQKIVGYLKLNFGLAQTELQTENALEIERIYVSRAFQGKNIGQKLYEKAVQIAKNARAEYIWLGVWEENPKAIQFYKKNGFLEFDTHIFKLGDDLQTDIMMKLKLAD